MTDLAHRCDLVVVGAGIVGLAVARAWLTLTPGRRVIVLEKEPEIAAHQTGRNSGVIHSGIYYKPGSLKATLCVEGARSMYAYASERGIAHERCGKVIVATRRDDLARLETLYERGIANRVGALASMSGDALRELEPHVRGLQGLHVAETGIIDYGAVAAAMRRDIQEMGGRVLTGARVRKLIPISGGWQALAGPYEIEARALINCAGLYSDRIAEMAGAAPSARIVAFRGEYYGLRPERACLVRNLIYPVPDPSFPFLGVHFTRTVGKGIEAGPNAVFALAREGYGKADFNWSDTRSNLCWPGFQRIARRYWRTGLAEMARSASKALFTRSLQELVPDVRAGDLVPGGSGVRAQAVTADGALVDDFLFALQPERRALHVLNVPSPAATASLAIGRAIAARTAGIAY